MTAGAATLSDAGFICKNFLRRSLHSHDRLCSEELDRVAIRSPDIYQRLKTLPYPPYFVPAKDVQETSSDLLRSGFHASDLRAMPGAGW